MTYREIELAQICDNGDCNRPYLDTYCSVLIEIIIFFSQMIFYWPRRYSKYASTIYILIVPKTITILGLISIKKKFCKKKPGLVIINLQSTLDICV